MKKFNNYIVATREIKKFCKNTFGFCVETDWMEVNPTRLIIAFVNSVGKVHAEKLINNFKERVTSLEFKNEPRKLLDINNKPFISDRSILIVTL